MVRIIEKDSVRHIIRRQPQITLPVFAYPGVHHVRINQMVDIHLFQCSRICVFKRMEPGIRKHPEIAKRIILLYTEKNGFNAGFFIVRSSYIMFLIVSSFLCIGKELPQTFPPCADPVITGIILMHNICGMVRYPMADNGKKNQFRAHI